MTYLIFDRFGDFVGHYPNLDVIEYIYEPLDVDGMKRGLEMFGRVLVVGADGYAFRVEQKEWK